MCLCVCVCVCASACVCVRHVDVLEGLLVLASNTQRDPQLWEELVRVGHHTAPQLCMGKQVAGMVSTHKFSKVSALVFAV